MLMLALAGVAGVAAGTGALETDDGVTVAGVTTAGAGTVCEVCGVEARPAIGDSLDACEWTSPTTRVTCRGDSAVSCSPGGPWSLRT